MLVRRWPELKLRWGTQTLPQVEKKHCVSHSVHRECLPLGLGGGPLGSLGSSPGHTPYGHTPHGYTHRHCQQVGGTHPTEILSLLSNEFKTG